MTGKGIALRPKPVFSKVIFKSLSAVEADASRSHQHEFNGSRAMRDAFGPSARKVKTDFVWMSDDGDWVADKGVLTWYDARARHPVRSEYRLYYRDNAVTQRANAGDFLLIGLRPDETALALLASGSGLAAARIFWLFGIEVRPGSAFAALDIDGKTGRALAARLNMGDSGSRRLWEADQASAPASGDRRIRAAAMLNQRSLERAVSAEETSWDDIDLQLLPGRPEVFAGAGLEKTIRGILSPGS